MSRIFDILGEKQYSDAVSHSHHTPQKNYSFIENVKNVKAIWLKICDVINLSLAILSPVTARIIL